jgi:mRNA-degrading endonuclease toxin of MazEF toxin-antitoxin module
MTIGEIHWVELPDAGGREQAGRRPAIVIQYAMRRAFCTALTALTEDGADSMDRA